MENENNTVLAASVENNQVKRLSLSVFFLVLANLVSVFGVIFLKWNQTGILFLYWSESVIIGMSNVVKMIFAKCSSLESKLVSIPGFMIIYFGGCFVYYIFLLALTGSNIRQIWPIPKNFFSPLEPVMFGVISLVISHTYSLITNYFLNNEWKTLSDERLFDYPYNRMFFMQIAFVGGMILGTILGGDKKYIIVVFILLKVYIDIRAHKKEHFFIG